MISRSNGSGLRIYPLPYLDVRLGPKKIFYVQDQMMKIQAEHPEYPEFKIKSAGERMLVSIAFADLYDMEDQFFKKPPDYFLFQKDFDYVYGSSRISLSVGKVNEKLDETGPSVPFRVSTRAIKADKADWFVMAALCMPHVQFIGWLTTEDLLPFMKGYSAQVFAGYNKIKCMSNLPIEKKRRKGPFV